MVDDPAGLLSRDLAVPIFRQRIAELLEWCRKLSSGDEAEETVHEARISSRKLRASLRILGRTLKRKCRRALLQDCRSLARALGTVRDADVMLRRLRAVRPGDDADARHALQIARSRLRNQRSRGLDRLPPEARRLLQRHEQSILDGQEWPPLRAAAQKPVPRRAVKLASSSCRKLLAKLLAHLPAAAAREESNQSALHEMRICAKRLRYTLEMFAGVFPEEHAGRLLGAAETCKSVQGFLGHVHDHHIWAARFREWRADALVEGIGDGPAAALGKLAAEERRLRDERLEAFREKWSRFQEDGALDRLQSVCDAPLS